MINVFAWLVFGMLVGLIASRLSKAFEGRMPLLTIIAGSMGALIGGVIFLIFDTTPLSVFNLWGIVGAIVGAIVVIGMVRIMIGRPI